MHGVRLDRREVVSPPDLFRRSATASTYFVACSLYFATHFNCCLAPLQRASGGVTGSSPVCEGIAEIRAPALQVLLTAGTTTPATSRSTETATVQPRTTQAETAGWRHTKYCRDGDATRNTTEGRDVTQNTLARGHVSQNTTGDVIHTNTGPRRAMIKAITEVGRRHTNKTDTHKSKHEVTSRAHTR